VIERRRNQVAVTIEVLREPHLDHPELALVREHDALRLAGRAGRVEEHRRLGRCRHDRFEWAGIEEGIEALGPFSAEADGRKPGQAILPARHVAEHELGAAIRQDVMDRLARKLEVHRHRDQAGADDAVVGGEIFCAVGGKNSDAVAARQAALGQRTRDAVRHPVELGMAEFARRLLTAEVDDGDLVEVALATDEIAKIPKARHRSASHQLLGGAVK
jgi:hypothetical protein